MYFDNCRWQEITFYFISLANGKFKFFNLASYVANIQIYSVCVSSWKGQKLFVACKNLTWFGKLVSLLPRASKTRLSLMEVVIKYLQSKGCKNCSLLSLCEIFLYLLVNGILFVPALEVFVLRLFLVLCYCLVGLKERKWKERNHALWHFASSQKSRKRRKKARRKRKTKKRRRNQKHSHLLKHQVSV